MKAIVSTRFGIPQPVVLRELTQPLPANEEVLVKNYASCVNYNNQLMVRGAFLPFRLLTAGRLMGKNRIPGTNFAGKVEATGKNVTLFKPGDDVYGDTFGNGQGCFAEYVCAPENIICRKPANLSYEEAAAMPEVGLVALRGLRDYGHIREGQKVLIYSASGGIGTAAIQIAKCYGAKVTAVCSTRNIDLVKSLGADHAIDYTKEDFTENGILYDVIFGIRKSRNVKDIIRALAPGGIYVSTAGPSPARLMQEMVTGPGLFKKAGKTIAVINPVIDVKDLETLTKLIEAGKLKPVIDRVYPLSKTAEAFRYYGKGHARGKVVIKIR